MTSNQRREEGEGRGEEGEEEAGE
jgi:hypothetical protein